MHGQDMRARRGDNNYESQRGDNFRGQGMRARGGDDDDDTRRDEDFMSDFRGRGTLAGMFNRNDANDDDGDTRRGGNFMSTVQGQNMLTRRDDDYDNIEAELRQHHPHLYNANADSNVRPYRPPSDGNDERPSTSSVDFHPIMTFNPPRYNGNMSPLKGQLRNVLDRLLNGMSVLEKARVNHNTCMDAYDVKKNEVKAAPPDGGDSQEAAALATQISALVATQEDLNQQSHKSLERKSAMETMLNFRLGEVCVEMLTAWQISKRLPADSALDGFHPLGAEIKDVDLSIPKMVEMVQFTSPNTASMSGRAASSLLMLSQTVSLRLQPKKCATRVCVATTTFACWWK
jgi:hypothetical protein